MGKPKLRVKHFHWDYFAIHELVQGVFRDKWVNVTEVFTAASDPSLWHDRHPLLFRDHGYACLNAEFLAQGDNLAKHKEQVAQEWEEAKARMPDARKKWEVERNRRKREDEAKRSRLEDAPIRYFG